MPLRYLAAWLLLLSGSASGQGALWVVDDDGGPGADFTDIQPAIDAAADGDVLLVREGSYGGFLADGRTLAIVGSGSERPEVVSNAANLTRIRNVPAGGWFVLEGLELRYPVTLGTPPNPSLQVEDCLGHVRIEDCAVIGSLEDMVRVEGSASVDFTRCEVRSEGSFNWVATALAIGSSSVSIHSSTFTASQDVFQNAQGCLFEPSDCQGGAGLFVEGTSFVYVAGSSLEGGRGVQGTPFPFCLSSGPGGHALELGAGEPLVVLREVTLIPGWPGVPADTCGGSVFGEEISIDTGTVLQPAGQPRAFSSTTPVAAGLGDATLRFEGQPGDFAISLATTTPSFLYLPPWTAVLLVDPAAFPALIGVVPASGVLEVTIRVDPLPPGWGSGVLFLQGVAFDASLAGHVGSPALLVMTSES